VLPPYDYTYDVYNLLPYPEYKAEGRSGGRGRGRGGRREGGGYKVHIIQM